MFLIIRRRSEVAVPDPVPVRQVLDHGGVQLRVHLRVGGVPHQRAAVAAGGLLVAGPRRLHARASHSAIGLCLCCFYIILCIYGNVW